MTKTRKEFTKAVYETIKDTALLSNISEEMVKVVEELPKEIVPGEVLFDGLTLFDGIKGIEDDIQQIHSITKKGKIVNLGDYYADNGAFDDYGWDHFIKSLSNLMTAEEYKSLLELAGYGITDWGDGTIAEYRITHEGIMHVSGQLYDGIIGRKTDVPFHHLVIDEGIKFIGQWNFSEWDQ